MVLGLVFGFSTQTQTQTQKPKKPKIQTQTQTQNTKKFGSKNPKTQNFLGLKISKIKFYGWIFRKTIIFYFKSNFFF